MKRKFVITDIHGTYKALIQVLQLSGFNYEDDELICLGDTADSWPETKECFDELLKVKNLIYLMGNHDHWLLGWIESGRKNLMWLEQGGPATLKSYKDGVPPSHIELLKKALFYYVDEENRMFVHGGFNTEIDINLQEKTKLIWNRTIFTKAIDEQIMHDKHGHPDKISTYNEIFIGHCPTISLNENYYSESPLHFCELWMMDTGAGYDGKLSIMNIETKEVFQSDKIPMLYPDFKGRK